MNGKSSNKIDGIFNRVKKIGVNIILLFSSLKKFISSKRFITITTVTKTRVTLMKQKRKFFNMYLL